MTAKGERYGLVSRTYATAALTPESKESVQEGVTVTLTR